VDAVLGTGEEKGHGPRSRRVSPTPMTPDALVRLLAEPTRMRVLAAIALGAETSAKISDTAKLPQKDVLIALRRLQEHGLVVSDTNGLHVGYEHLRQLSRETAAADDQTEVEQADVAIRPFIRDGHLLTLPAAPGRRRAVLEHIAGSSFEAGATYDEPAVNEKLRAWCDGGEVDHVAIRRYLIEAGILVRANGIYARTPESLPDRGVAERYVTAMGLD
jgi:hypothetical protein